MTSLMEISNASRDPNFQGRVHAATVVLGMPYHPNQVMFVAANVDLSNGPDAVPDDEILAVLDPTDPEPEVTP